ncbi:translation initiation factor IF-2-like [Equus quagga]|uniref:translation initiation factor IF-2-like n=1 Tax=Equus quagga TaxID=89248 RepID=UPI001EE2F0E3|nr:translation initiation factor IF-2-like [Equus quagga]
MAREPEPTRYAPASLASKLSSPASKHLPCPGPLPTPCRPLPRPALSRPRPPAYEGYRESSRARASVEPRLRGRRAKFPPPSATTLAAPPGSEAAGTEPTVAQAGPRSTEPLCAEAAPAERKERGCAPCPRPAGGHPGPRATAPRRGPGSPSAPAAAEQSPRPPGPSPARPPAGSREGERADAGGATASKPPGDPGTLRVPQSPGEVGRGHLLPPAKREPPIRAFECTS